MKFKENIIKNISNIVSYIIILAIGFIIGYYYLVIHNAKETQSSPIIEVNDLQDISIGFTDRDELMIIKRKTGKYVVYEDSVAMVIFNTLMNKKYNLEVN